MGTEGPRTVLVSGLFLRRPAAGVQRFAREMLCALQRAGPTRPRIVLAAPIGRRVARLESERIAAEAAPLAGEVILDRSSLPAPLWTQIRLPVIFRRLGADLLWSPSNVGPLSVRRQVVTIFDASFLERPEWFSRAFSLYYRVLLPRLARRAARVTTVSCFSREELARRGVVPAGAIDVVPCGVSSAFHPDADSAEWTSRMPYVLTVGSRDPRKNLAALLRAWELLPRSIASSHRLLAAGADSSAFARESLGRIPDRVELLGYVPERSLPGLYAGAAAFVYPSLYEGFGLPPLEAMASGTPVLVSRAASLPEVCGGAALYLDPDDPRSIADGLEAILQDPELRVRLRAAGLERAAAFTWEGAAKTLLGVFETVLPERMG
ncbi:MAG TPA: glycosyltransferase family 1 protein [Planctomycetota bacterium]|nr:glycosyltransferase family 1 protein [Planctomycetota bacterium]